MYEKRKKQWRTVPLYVSWKLETLNECTLQKTNDVSSLNDVSWKLEDWNECTLPKTIDAPSLYIFLKWRELVFTSEKLNFSATPRLLANGRSWIQLNQLLFYKQLDFWIYYTVHNDSILLFLHISKLKVKCAHTNVYFFKTKLQK